MKYCNKQSVSSGRTLHYLKKIFENDLYNQVDQAELKDFCETYLAYLLDDGDWKIDVYRVGIGPSSYYYVMIWRIYETNVDGSHSYPNSTWDDVSDYFIPFFKVLIDNYELIPNVSRSMKTGELVDNLVEFSGANVPKEKILNDLIPGNQPAKTINFKIKRKI